MAYEVLFLPPTPQDNHTQIEQLAQPDPGPVEVEHLVQPKEGPLIAVHLPTDECWQRFTTLPESRQLEVVTFKCTPENAIQLFLSTFRLPIGREDMDVYEDGQVILTYNQAEPVRQAEPGMSFALEMATKDEPDRIHPVFFRPWLKPHSLSLVVEQISLNMEINFN